LVLAGRAPPFFKKELASFRHAPCITRHPGRPTPIFAARYKACLIAVLLPCIGWCQAHRGGELHLSAYQASGTIDPQINYESDFWQIYFVTQDGLLGFRKAEGKEGLEVVPDLAEALPEIGDGGKTYLFHLRRGLKFSTGQDITVGDVVASYRRMFKVLGPNVGSWYNIIVGADACLKTPQDCTLDGGVAGDAQASTVTLHLTRADSEFAQKIALPFASILPADTPPHDLGTTPPAATGPYMIQSYNPVRQMVLTRNPYFHQWSEAAQPDGFVDRIIYRYGLQNESEVTEVENGALDWEVDPPPLDRLSEIGAGYTKLAHIHPLLAYYYVTMNTHLAPFDNVLARRAFALAVNRKVAVNLYGGPALGTPICQLLPAGLAGYAPYCPFTKNPDARWSAPDLATARTLVKASGTAGMKVTFVCSDREVERSIGIYLQSVLNDIGYRASVHSISYNIRDTYLENSSNHVQIGLTDWYQDYPSPSDFLDVLLSCASFHPGSDASINMSGFCDPAIDARMQGAIATELTDPEAADRQWTEIDRTLTDLAPLTTLFQINKLDVVSPRVGHFKFSPLFHFIFSEAWVK
jgi:peptide/nickel transport system substrate-binding protein